MSRVARIVVPGFPHHEDEARVDQIRAHTRTGRPCGSPAFLDQLENLTHRAFRPKKRGRNAKASKLEKMIDREYLNVVYP